MAHVTQASPSKSDQEQEKREPCKPTDNTTHIQRGHWQERPRASLLRQGFRTPEANEDSPTITVMETLAAGKDGDTSKTASKYVIPVTTSTTLIPYRLGDTNARHGSGSEQVDGLVLDQVSFG
jgi:hypothetical protein